MKKEQSKTLTLNKETVSQLNTQTMNAVQGGTGSNDCTLQCLPTEGVTAVACGKPILW